jgi:monofunctional chorismate mutase
MIEMRKYMELKDLRNKIDQIDQELATLIEQRLEVVKQIGDYKKKHNLPILDQNREQEVLDKNSKYLSNESNKEAYLEIMKNIMDVSKKIEK